MTDKTLIQAKVAQILNYLEELAPVLKLNVSEIIKDIKTLRFLERNFQLIVDTVLDINSHIIFD